jgi:hypothetical protein
MKVLSNISNLNISRSNLIRLISLVVVFTVAINLKLLSVLVNTEAFSSILDLTDVRDYQFDEYCDKNGEWESLSRHYYFKRAASFYFSDACLLHMSFIADQSITQSRFSLELIVEYAHQIISAKLTNNIDVSTRWMVHEYNLMQMSASFNLTRFLIEQNLPENNYRPVELDKLKLTVYVNEYYANMTTKSGIEVVVKNLKNIDDSVKKTALVCSKCYRMNKTIQNTRLLKWWLDLNRNIGYDKVVLCNHSIDLDSRLLIEYKDFLTLTKVISSCITK